MLILKAIDNKNNQHFIYLSIMAILASSDMYLRVLFMNTVLSMLISKAFEYKYDPFQMVY